jgi:DNA repair protein RadC
MMQPSFRGIDHEQCWVLYLNRSKRILGKECVTVGTDRMAPLDARRIVKKAMEGQASAIILLHNHPAGSPRPSEGDLLETGRLKNALNLFGIDLLDHIIVADGAFYSFHEEQLFRAD